MATDYVDAGQAVGNSSLSGIVGSAPPVTQNVDYERILDARSEPQNWLTYYGAYDGQRYSPLDQINRDNVRRLAPAWVFQCGSTGLHAGKSTYSFEASPIVVDGVMFVSAWDGWVWALDARTGDQLWQYKHAIPYDTSLCCGNVNRGVAVAEGLVFVVTLNAHIIALDADSGKIRAHFQYTPHDLWDYDSTMEHILFDLDGQKLAAHFDKNGFLYILDRTNMEPVRVAPFVDRIYWGAGVAVDGEDQAGYVSAYDPRTAQERWRWTNDICMCASLLATGGDLVFGGEPTGEFNAWDANSGELLWQFQCGSGHHSSPSTYSIDGQQYIVAPSGWGGWAEGFLPKMLGSSHGSALFAFALPE